MIADLLVIAYDESNNGDKATLAVLSKGAHKGQRDFLLKVFHGDEARDLYFKLAKEDSNVVRKEESEESE